MPGIREELTLVDKFTNVFDRFLNLGNKAASQSAAVEAANQQLQNSFTVAAERTNALTSGHDSASRAAEQNATALNAAAGGADIFTSAYNTAEQSIKKTLDSCSTFADSLNVVGQSVKEYEGLWTSSANQFDRGALAATNSLQDLVSQGYISANAITVLTDVAEACATQEALLAEAAALGTEGQRALAQSVQNEAVRAFTAASEAVNTAVTPLERYQAELRGVESQISKNSLKLNEAAGKYTQIVQAEGAASAAAEKQRATVEQLTAKTFDLINRQKELKSKLDEISDSGGKASGAMDKNAQSAERAANGGLNSLLKKLTKIAAAYLSISKIKDILGDAMQQSEQMAKMQGIFGEKAGASAMKWAQNTANDMGRLTSSITNAVTEFSKITTKPINLDKFTAVTDKLARFSKDTSFDQMSSGIAKAFMRGKTEGLSAATGINQSLLDQFRVGKLLEAGNVGEALDGLNKAAEAAGMTQEAYERMLSTPQAKADKFLNTMKNGAIAAGQSFINAFAPAFDALNNWLSSDKAQKFFAIIGKAAQLAGATLAKFISGLTWISTKAPFVTYILAAIGAVIAAAGIKAAIAAIKVKLLGDEATKSGIKMAMAWIKANWQLLAVAAAVGIAIYALQNLGEVGKWVAMIIGVIILAYAAWQVAQWALNTSMYACPIVWILIAIIAVIALVVMAIYFWSDAFIAATEWIVGAVFWLGAMFYNVGMGIGNFFIWLWAKIVNGWNYAGAKIMTIFSQMGAGISNFVNDVGYWFATAGTAIANAFISGANTAIKAVNWIIDAINKIPGVNLSHATTFAKMADPVKAAKVQATDYTKDFQEWQPDYLEYADMGAWFQKGASYGRTAGEMTVGAINGLVDMAKNIMAVPDTSDMIGNNIEDFTNFDGVDKMGDIGKVGKVGKIDSAVKLDDEDLKLLVDMAERKYVANVNVRTLSPNVTVEVTNNNGEPLDGKKIANAVKTILDEQTAMHTDLSYA